MGRRHCILRERTLWVLAERAVKKDLMLRRRLCASEDSKDKPLRTECEIELGIYFPY
jgi:hypothetical protein